jgi:hypothetical protein
LIFGKKEKSDEAKLPTNAFVLLGLTNSVFHRSVRCSAFCPSLTFTIRQLNKILSLVTTFGCRRRGRRPDEVPNSTNALNVGGKLYE